ncbi:MAG: hypothetical protein JRF59_08930 [Deltaproteobacteria bacterium]|nr:hypothetical protein [Deltaproteobacteria bacterium]MBW2347953.1 hypothetical protein [Deltaproteobacteria bacterium]
METLSIKYQEMPEWVTKDPTSNRSAHDRGEGGGLITREMHRWLRKNAFHGSNGTSKLSTLPSAARNIKFP